MKRRILDYQKYIEGKLAENAAGEDWDRLTEEHLVKIGFFQHERLVHLIVMALFAMLEIISVAAAVISGVLGMYALAAAVLVLLIPYIGHYYFLENSVQNMYDTYDRMRKLKGGAADKH